MRHPLLKIKGNFCLTLALSGEACIKHEAFWQLCKELQLPPHVLTIYNAGSRGDWQEGQGLLSIHVNNPL